MFFGLLKSDFNESNFCFAKNPPFPVFVLPICCYKNYFLVSKNCKKFKSTFLVPISISDFILRRDIIQNNITAWPFLLANIAVANHFKNIVGTEFVKEKMEFFAPKIWAKYKFPKIKKTTFILPVFVEFKEKFDFEELEWIEFEKITDLHPIYKKFMKKRL